MLSIALPKGRMGEKVYAMLEKAGYSSPDFSRDNRKLVLPCEGRDAQFFLVKPSDVAIYVERGAADIGVAGRDTLLELSPDIYELLDLKLGICRLAVAAPEGFRDRPDAPLRVATKYPHVATRHFQEKNRDIRIIKLNGSIEIAPLLGLSDVIVDIVETGTTLRENHLRVLEDIATSSARLIACKSSYAFKREAIDEIVARFAEGIAP
ncbi:MAG: ATP phosphoribosyltransferase [Oscillospiraceae bacterium]|jgi:ATP phosphoribosyltransferase|nr:ATP phosphoribosyltransferase [Oscillospiraceae bacterium]